MRRTPEPTAARRRSTLLVLIATVLSVASPPPLALAAAGPLDGRSFAGETGEEGKATGDPEEFVFAGGMFDPLQCHPWGFAATPYTARKEGAATAFTAEHVNAGGDRMRWEGRVEGDALAGTMTYWEGKKPPKKYWFRATRKAG